MIVQVNTLVAVQHQHASTDLQILVQAATIFCKSLIGDALNRLCCQLQLVLTIRPLLEWTILAEACTRMANGQAR
jgi:hypothetical protein